MRWFEEFLVWTIFFRSPQDNLVEVVGGGNVFNGATLSSFHIGAILSAPLERSEVSCMWDLMCLDYIPFKVHKERYIIVQEYQLLLTQNQFLCTSVTLSCNVSRSCDICGCRLF